MAKAFADEPAVAGYDLFNEPGIGATPPVSNGLLLGRYYDAAITAIRDGRDAPVSRTWSSSSRACCGPGSRST